ncbi:conserved hypothetical protein [Acidithiobacillus caldus SM-1]|uniref:Uncharacterized protein n=1 Tax=Acidithiobacillus caldus (strain SM-1) TaxID=990288 RepID=F9ZRX7_ACICS|nr:hypothetical protein [Acidithiobacillus caldus]AEK58762.1 conserved hypothetical protein [Acidithiobacillus caldus SM-1]
MLGYGVDHKPVEGTVVFTSSDLVVLKRGAKAEYTAFDTAILPSDVALEIGNKVRITPYARRRFDGTFVYDPIKNPDGTSTLILGDNKSYLPIEKGTIQSEYLLALVDLIERGKTSSYRTIAQVLIDAGAYLEPIQHNDPVGDALKTASPALTFRIASQKLEGYLTIFYDYGMDYYGVRVLDYCGSVIDTVTDIDFTALAEVVENLVDDGTWKIAKVEQLGKTASRRKTA